MAPVKDEAVLSLAVTGSPFKLKTVKLETVGFFIDVAFLKSASRVVFHHKNK